MGLLDLGFFVCRNFVCFCVWFKGSGMGLFGINVVLNLSLFDVYG